MREAWWKLVDFVVAAICLVLLVGDWWERHETRKVMAILTPAQRRRILEEVYRA